MTPLLQACGLSLSRHGADGAVRSVLSDVHLCVNPGEMVMVAGPNGSGKSTLLRVASGLLAPDEGQVTLCGHPLQTLRDRNRARLLACLPQAGEGEEIPFTVMETVLMGRAPWQNFAGHAKDEDFLLADEAMRLADVFSLRTRSVRMLSGGERQRVFLARALCQNPRLLVLDEPTSAQDYGKQIDLMNMLSELCMVKELGILMATHDLNLASLYASSLLLLVRGASLGQGRPSEVLCADTLSKVYDCQLLLDEHPCVQTPRITLPSPLRTRSFFG